MVSRASRQVLVVSPLDVATRVDGGRAPDVVLGDHSLDVALDRVLHLRVAKTVEYGQKYTLQKKVISADGK